MSTLNLHYPDSAKHLRNLQTCKHANMHTQESKNSSKSNKILDYLLIYTAKRKVIKMQFYRIANIFFDYVTHA